MRRRNLSKPRLPRRTDGFKKAGKVRVKSKLEVLELDLYISPSDGKFMLIVNGEEFKGELEKIKKQVGDYLDAREELTWARYIGISYYAESGPKWGSQERHYVDEELDEDVVIKGIQFSFEVFDLSSPLTLHEDHVARQYRYTNKEQERRKRFLRRNDEDTDWERDDSSNYRRTEGEETVDVGYLEKGESKSMVFLEYTDARYQGVVAIQDAISKLDKKMRALFKADDLGNLLVAMSSHGLLGDGS